MPLLSGSMQDKPIIKVDDLSVVFQRWGQSVPALVGIGFELLAGQWCLLTGHNGSGKSSLLKVLAGRLKANAGRVAFDAGGASAKFATDLFYVSQDPLAGTAEGLTLLENMVVADPAHVVPFGAAARLARYSPLLDTFGLSARANQLLKLFSGGERQQIALLIAKLRDPTVLLLDEPFAALDAARVPDCLELVASMNARGCTVLHVTHDMALIGVPGRRILTLERGSIVRDCQSGPAPALS